VRGGPSLRPRLHSAALAASLTIALVGCNHTGLSGTRGASAGNAKLPDGFPANFPLPSGSSVIRGAVTRSGESTRFRVDLSVPATRDNVDLFYASKEVNGSQTTGPDWFFSQGYSSGPNFVSRTVTGTEYDYGQSAGLLGYPCLRRWDGDLTVQGALKDSGVTLEIELTGTPC
jgi:hypothetical protein